MHNVWLIAKREYLERVRTKAFLISTLMIPLLMGEASSAPSSQAARPSRPRTLRSYLPTSNWRPIFRMSWSTAKTAR